MSAVNLTVTVEFPDDVDEETFASFSGVRTTLTSDGIPPELHAYVLLAVAENLVKDSLRQALTTANPLMPESQIEALVTSQARVEIFHDVAHLPTTSSTGASSSW